MAGTSHNDSVEIWKDIPGFEGEYQICVEAQCVRSLDRLVNSKAGSKRRVRARVLRPSARANGYQCVSLRGTLCDIHVLVCEAAHGPRPSVVHVVRHLNGDPSDNRPANLQWGTPKDNGGDTVRHGRTRRGQKNGQAKLTESDVIEIRRRCRAGETNRAVAHDFGVTRQNVGLIMSGQKWQWLKSEQ